jgi:predicted metal-dependent hydrolase
MTTAIPQPCSSQRKEAHSSFSVPTPPSDTIVDFKSQVAHWAEHVRVKPRQIRVQRMLRKWASCSTRGTVSFNSDLLTQPEDFREYAIVHELLHLKVPNHGKLFKTMLRAYLPNYESIHPQPSSLDGQVAGRTL